MERALCQRDQRRVNEMEEGDGHGTWELAEYGYSRASSARTSHVLKPGDDIRWGRLGMGGCEEQGSRAQGHWTSHDWKDRVMQSNAMQLWTNPPSDRNRKGDGRGSRGMGDRQSNGTEESQTARA